MALTGEFFKDGEELPLLSSVLSLPSQLLSHVRLFVTPWTVACQAPLSMRILQAKNIVLVWHALLQGIFPTQGLNPGLPHFRWILYQLSNKGSPKAWYIIANSVPL